MGRQRRKRKSGRWVGGLVTAFLALPASYLAAALVGSLVPVNAEWMEPSQGTTIYIADNGIHADLILPVRVGPLDWSKRFKAGRFLRIPPHVRWIAFGSGERDVYLNTPSWWDIQGRTVLAAIAGGPRVIHVEYVGSPSYAAREIRLRPAEFRRLWGAIGADFALDRSGQPRPVRNAHFDVADGFYEATGQANALRTCNIVAARWLMLAGVRTSVWPPFVQGLVWRYHQNRS